MTLFVDSSAFYAAADSGDRSTVRAKDILASGEPLLTTDHVLLETWFLLRSRLGADTADHFWSRLRAGVASIEPVSLADLEAAWAIGERFPDQGFSIVDRTSFAVMERLGIFRAVAFDHHYAVYRFGRNRDRAFELVG